MEDEEHAPEMVRRNIERVLRLEQHASQVKTWPEAVTDGIGRFVGTLSFVAVQLALVAIWITLNCGVLGIIKPFDPYPFNLLSAFSSCEAVILAAFVLMAQNRMSSLADRRDHFDLQVNLMAEQEASITIQMLDRISRKLGVVQENPEEALALSRTSALEHLAEELHAQLPDTVDSLPRDQDRMTATKGSQGLQ